MDDIKSTKMLLMTLGVLSVLACSNQEGEGNTQQKPSGPARATFDTCIIASHKANASLPMRQDSVTTTTGTSCRQEGDRIVFVYDYKLDLLKSQIEQNLEGLLTTEIKNALCTNPAMKPLLQFADIRYDYYDANSVFIFSIVTRIQECNSK